MRRHLSVLGATLLICGGADTGRPAAPPLDRLDTFALPKNVRIDGEGLAFYYNLYEVAPYAFDPTEIVLTYDELDGLLREGVGGRNRSGDGDQRSAPGSR